MTVVQSLMQAEVSDETQKEAGESAEPLQKPAWLSAGGPLSGFGAIYAAPFLTGARLYRMSAGPDRA